MDKIFVSGLQLEAIIGIYPEERLVSQAIVLDIELTVNIQKAAHSDSMADSVDYAALVKKLQGWVADSQFQLIEALANHLAEKILKTFVEIQTVRLRLYKFPKGLDVASVSIEVIRPIL